MAPSTKTAGGAKADGALPIQDTRPVKSKNLKKGPLGFAKIFYDLFATVEQRAPPSNKKTKHIRLISIRVSHFCEKARWVLDLLEADEDSPYYFTEDCHPPGFHSFESVAASSNQGSATPMIVISNGIKTGNDNSDNEVFCNSDVIVEQLYPQLYPKKFAQEIRALEQDLGDRVGATVRCYAYDNLLQEEYYSALVIMATPDCSKVEQFMFEKMLPHGLSMGIRKSLGVNAAAAAASQQALVEIFAELSKKLEKQDYLVGNQFTAADLTFAALCSPLLRPPEMSNFQCADEALPKALAEFSAQLKETKAGKHALRMYAEHRFVAGTPESDKKVAVRKANRDRFPFGLAALFAVGVVAVMVGVSTKLVSSSSRGSD